MEKGANFETKTSDDGSTALYIASWGGHVGVVRLLLEKGANIDAPRSNDIDGSTALLEAALYLQTEAVQLLLENGEHTCDDHTSEYGVTSGNGYPVNVF